MSLIILIVLFSFETEDCFQRILQKFEDASAKNEVSISMDMALCVFGEEIINESTSSVKAIMKFSDGKHISLLTENGFLAGGYASNYVLSSFDEKGALIAHFNIGGNSVQREGGVYNTLNILDGNIIQIEEMTVTFDQNDNQIPLGSKYRFIKIDSIGYSKISFPQPSFGRLHKASSEHLLRKEEIEKYTVSELDIMRNEIFADHGYKFKTEKWQKYFAGKTWYAPYFDDVNGKLSIIERINVQTILEVSRTK